MSARQRFHSNRSSSTLIVRSSLPREMRTLSGGRAALVSCVSTVALMAFCPRMCTVGVNACRRQRSARVLETVYLEEFKQHVVEVGGHVDDVQRLTAAFGCEGNKRVSVDNDPPPHPTMETYN